MTTQKKWIQRAQSVLPAGGLGNFDPEIFIREGNGSRVWDLDGKEYIDYLIGSGPMLLGHGHPEVLDAVHSQLGKGMTFFANNTPSVNNTINRPSRYPIFIVTSTTVDNIEKVDNAIDIKAVNKNILWFGFFGREFKSNFDKYGSNCIMQNKINVVKMIELITFFNSEMVSL